IQGSTTISWNAPGADVIEIRIGSPDGQLFTRMGYRGSIQTGIWVTDGMTFYLQDVTGGRPLTSDDTLATLVVHSQRSNAANFSPGGGPQAWLVGSPSLLGLALCGVVLLRSRPRAKRVWSALIGAVLLAFAGLTGMSETTTRAQAGETASSSSQVA